MNYKDIDFSDTYFVLEVEDGRKISFPFNKLDIVTEGPEEHRLTISIKGHGSFSKEYAVSYDLNRDAIKLMRKGKSPC